MSTSLVLITTWKSEIMLVAGALTIPAGDRKNSSKEHKPYKKNPEHYPEVKLSTVVTSNIWRTVWLYKQYRTGCYTVIPVPVIVNALLKLAPRGIHCRATVSLLARRENSVWRTDVLLERDGVSLCKLPRIREWENIHVTGMGNTVVYSPDLFSFNGRVLRTPESDRQIDHLNKFVKVSRLWL